MEEFEQLLEEWEDSVENFMKWIVSHCGIERDSDTYKVIKENIVTMEDLALFVDVFRGDLDEIPYVTEMFMEKKRSAA